jgi:hypothetical protein
LYDEARWRCKIAPGVYRCGGTYTALTEHKQQQQQHMYHRLLALPSHGAESAGHIVTTATAADGGHLVKFSCTF